MEEEAEPARVHTVPRGALPTWARLRDALLDLSRRTDDDNRTALLHLMRTSAEALAVDRVSFWHYDPDRRAILRQCMHCRVNGPDYSPAVLSADQAPHYFRALDATLTLAAEDVHTDERTAELLEDYLKPLGIGAMLDVSVRHSGVLVGVLCHEHIGGPRDWNAEERMFAAAIAALTAQLLEHGQRLRAEDGRRHALLLDHLTGLANRSGLLESLSNAFANDPGRLGPLLLIDIDRFHRINHAFGAEVGDFVLATIADRLRGLYPDSALARLGNDQFAVVCPRGIGPLRDAALAEVGRVRDALQAPVRSDARSYELTVSIGLVPDLASYRSADAALRDAMIAVDNAARGPRGNLAVFDASARERVSKRLMLEQDIRRGAQNGEFELHLQPIVAADSGTVVAAEALMRWRHPERGLLAPIDFIEVAEESGQLSAIQAGCLAPVLAAVARWRRRPDMAEFKLALNLASAQLGDRLLPRYLEKVCQEAGLAPAALNLEITENVLLETVHDVEHALNALHEMGATLALDDFGTGFASLTHLVRLPLDAVKIDRSFVGRLDQTARAPAIVRGIVAMARAVGLRVVAEGVETEAQASILTDMGCFCLQGYRYGRPIALDAFEATWMAGPVVESGLQLTIEPIGNRHAGPGQA